MGWGLFVLRWRTSLFLQLLYLVQNYVELRIHHVDCDAQLGQLRGHRWNSGGLVVLLHVIGLN